MDTATAAAPTAESRVKTIIADFFHVPVAEVNGASSLVDDLGADSLDTVELVMELEEQFNHEVPDTVAEGFDTVQKIVDYFTQLPA